VKDIPENIPITTESITKTTTIEEIIFCVRALYYEDRLVEHDPFKNIENISAQQKFLIDNPVLEMPQRL
jgi:hypothetical protein